MTDSALPSRPLRREDRLTATNARHERIVEWICTGRHIIETDYVKPATTSSNGLPVDDDKNNNTCAAGADSGCVTAFVYTVQQ